MFVKEARVPGEEFDINEDVDNFDIEIVDCTEGMDVQRDQNDENNDEEGDEEEEEEEEE